MGTTTKFTATVELGGKTATGFEVPDAVVESLGSGRRPAVRVTINDHTYRSTVASRDGRFMLPLSADNRTKAGVAAGDEVTVGLELDTAPRVLELPDDFAAALGQVPAAKRFFDGLTYSKQRWYVLPIEGAKKPETRERRIAKAVAMLLEGRTP